MVLRWIALRRIALRWNCVHRLRGVARCRVGSLLHNNNLFSAASIVMSMMSVVAMMTMMSMMSLLLNHHNRRSHWIAYRIRLLVTHRRVGLSGRRCIGDRRNGTRWVGIGRRISRGIACRRIGSLLGRVARLRSWVSRIPA